MNVNVNVCRRDRPTAQSFYLKACYTALIIASLFNVSSAVKRVPRDLILPPRRSLGSQYVRLAAVNSSTLDVFEVVPPVTTPVGAANPCVQTLMVYSFANSYEKPFAGK